MAKVTLSVSGMKCDACENLIHDALMEKEGVIEVKADHQAKCVEIDYDESKVDLDVLKQTIVDQGFKVAGFGKQTLLDQIKAFFESLLKFLKS
ncbi:MAG: heavy-metal-associated domain-containing protein [Methylohalobius sp.]